MAQADLNVANQSGAGFRADLNNQLLALGTLQSGASAPSTTFAFMWWADTANDLLKIRNAANNAWVTVGTLSATNLGLVPSTQTASTSAAGIVQLSTSTSSTSTTLAATPSAVKTAYDLANAALPKSGGTMTGDLVTPSLNGGQLAGMRNRIINGAMAIDQRNNGNSQTITAGAALAYTVDRWYAYCTGANVTGDQIQGATANQFRYQFTGAASVTAIGFAQRIEAINSADLASTTATLSVDLANSLLTTVTWTAFYANTTDSFGTLAVPTKTQIATGTFTVNSTVTRYSTQISIPAAATTGIEIRFTVGAQTSGTWTIGDVQLERGGVATPYERRDHSLEVSLCQRYYQTGVDRWDGYATNGISFSSPVFFATYMRLNPNVTQTNAVNTSFPATPSTSNVSNIGFYSARTANATGGGAWTETWVASIEL